MIEVLLIVGAMEAAVELPIGESLAVRVEDIATTGYQWQLLPPDPSVLTFAGSSLSPGAAPGAAGRRTFTFKAIAGGHAEIRLQLRRSWEADKPPAREGKVEVTVRP